MFAVLLPQNVSTCTVEITQYALKGQKLLAQGSALGCFGRKSVALTGRLADCHYTQGVALG